MAELLFKGRDLTDVIEEALEATDTKALYGQDEPAPRGLILAHDQGVYLISNSADRKPGKSPIAYAEGCDPRVNPDWYERARDLVGGDDFAEFVPIDPEWREAARLYLTLTDEQMEIYVHR